MHSIAACLLNLIRFFEIFRRSFSNTKTIPHSDVCCHTYAYIHGLRHIWAIERSSNRKHENNLGDSLQCLPCCSFYPSSFCCVTYFHLHYSIEPWSRKICFRFFFSSSFVRFCSHSSEKNHWSTMVSFIFLSSFSSSFRILHVEFGHFCNVVVISFAVTLFFFFFAFNIQLAILVGFDSIFFIVFFFSLAVNRILWICLWPVFIFSSFDFLSRLFLQLAYFVPWFLFSIKREAFLEKSFLCSEEVNISSWNSTQQQNPHTT